MIILKYRLIIPPFFLFILILSEEKVPFLYSLPTVAIWGFSEPGNGERKRLQPEIGSEMKLSKKGVDLDQDCPFILLGTDIIYVGRVASDNKVISLIYVPNLRDEEEKEAHFWVKETFFLSFFFSSSSHGRMSLPPHRS